MKIYHFKINLERNFLLQYSIIHLKDQRSTQLVIRIDQIFCSNKNKTDNKKFKKTQLEFLKGNK